MRKADLASIPVGAIIALGLAFILFGSKSVQAVTTTIIGWNVPSGTTFNNGLEVLVFPLVGLGLFTSLPLMLGRKGDFVVTMALLGMLVGSVFGMLTITLTGTGSTGVIPFGVAVECGILFGVWMWKGGG